MDGSCKGQSCGKGLEMLKTHASILSEDPVDPITPDNSDVEEAAMIGSDDDSNHDIDITVGDSLVPPL